MWTVIRLSCAILLLLSGCRVGPRYHAPCTETPIEWKHQDPISTAECCEMESEPPLGYWWEIFDDPILDSLEAEAIVNNPNMAVALAHIAEAWAIVGVNRADLFPQVNLNPNFIDQGVLFKFYTPGGLKIPGIPPGFFNTPFRIHQMQYNLPLNLSWELDLWGKYRSEVDSAISNAESQVEAYRAALLSLTADLASSYFNLRYLDSIIELLEETMKTRKSSYELAKTRYDKGLINYTDVASASLEMSNTESDYLDVVRQRGLQENFIATLIGTPASELIVNPMPLAQAPPIVPSGVPSEVLLRRPDLSEAERDMAAEHAQIGVAYASFFPSLTLTGAFGFESPTFKDFLTWKSRFWQIGASIFQTVFDGGRNKSNLDAAWARFDQAYGTYRGKVLTAFQEVEDALNNLEYEKKQSDSLERSVEDASRLLGLSTTRYQKGLTTYIEVVVNQRSELDAKRNYVNVLGARYQSTIQLIKALGGGWDCK